MRVQVSFGPRVRVGMIVALARESDQEPDRLKPILALLDPQPLLGADDLELILWAADYYRQPPGEALFSALPARLRRAEPPLEPVPPGQPGWRLTAAGRDQASGTRAPRQAEIQRLLGDHPEGLGEAGLRSRLGEVKTPLRALAERGWIEPCHLVGDEPVKAPESGPELNPRQTEAIAAVSAALDRFQPFLLEGVTGSGKTEVYIRLLLRVLEAGGQALLLVPEIGLTPQLRRRLARRFPGRLAILHSALNATERERAWQAAASGAADLVLGTRSAVFVPLPRLRLILVDEEHDLSFKQQDGFRYSARDLAVRRAKRAGCPLVLGSATPSLESSAQCRDRSLPAPGVARTGRRRRAAGHRSPGHPCSAPARWPLGGADPADARAVRCR
jgi:primosomal protein N' (replication factor Y)